MSLTSQLLSGGGDPISSGVAGLGAGVSGLSSPSGVSGMIGSGVGSAIGSFGGPVGAGLGAALGGTATGMGIGQASGAGIGTAIGGIFGPVGSIVGSVVGSSIGQGYDNQRADKTQTGAPAPGEVEANDAASGGTAASAWGSADDGPMGSYAGDMGGSGGSGGGGGGGKVICTELYMQGLISREYWDADTAFGASLPQHALRGYHLWAKPIVRLMKRSPLATKIAYVIAMPWVQEMAFRQAGLGNGNVIGSAMLVIGVPICAAIGRLYGYARVRV